VRFIKSSSKICWWWICNDAFE